MTNYVPVWEDGKKNRFFVVAENHVFRTKEAAMEFQICECLNYIPFGWITSGVVEVDLSDGAGEIPHVPATGPFGFPLAIIGGPAFDAALEASA